MSWVTPDIDKVEMVNEILNDDARQNYIVSNKDLLEDQTKAFYEPPDHQHRPGSRHRFEFSS